MNRDIPDSYIPDRNIVLDYHCTKCGIYTEYGMANRTEWVCPGCAGYLEQGENGYNGGESK